MSKIEKVRLAIFCSGSGSNAEKIIQYFKHHENIEVALLLANTPEAYALQRAEKYGIPTYVFSRAEFYQTEKVLEILQKSGVNWIILAGFLWLVPAYLVTHYAEKIINIHPALLPKYGGKGMYGMKVHEAVVAAGDTHSGITIHYVNNLYDEGNVIFQARCIIEPGDTAEQVAKKVQELEHKHFPEVIENIITQAKGNP